MGDPPSLPSGQTGAHHAGVDPSIVQSGEQHHQEHIGKGGSPLLRTLLVEAAHLAPGGTPAPSINSTPARRRRSGPAKRSSRWPENFSSWRGACCRPVRSTERQER
ncbi:MAG TPA: transposase [bacterium]|nr:transposase [bacterium]